MEYVILVFLLFFAVLAFAWFYLQRAKSRDAGKVSSASTTEVSAPPTADSTASQPVETTTTTSTSTDQS